MATPRLDHLAANGTDGIHRRILTANGKGLSVEGQAGTDLFEEVYLAEGLEAPSGDAWDREDIWELLLTSGDESDKGRLFTDVPVAAVRSLIEEHGGEGAEQDPIG